MGADPVVDAEALVEELFPHAVWAVVTGSVLTELRTSGSDLDIVVCLPDGDPDAPHRASRHFRGWPVELFVHDGETLAHYLAGELRDRRPTLHRMLATGVAVTGDPAALRAECARVLTAGPRPLTQEEIDRERYALTDLIDDLTHAVDAAERITITATGWVAAGDAALRLGNHWAGRGKWLLRELRDMDPELAGEWLTAAGSAALTVDFAREVLDRAGGPLFDGYRAAGVRPRSA
jgi:hypothetical protein